MTKARLSSDNLERENWWKCHKWTISVLNGFCFLGVIVSNPKYRNPNSMFDPILVTLCIVGLEWVVFLFVCRGFFLLCFVFVFVFLVSTTKQNEPSGGPLDCVSWSLSSHKIQLDFTLLSVSVNSKACQIFFFFSICFPLWREQRILTNFDN